MKTKEMVRLCPYFAVALFTTALQAANKLTLDSALELADRNHPQLQASAAFVDAASAGITTAKTYPNPEAGFMAGRQTARVPGAVPGATHFYSFVQPLELGSLRPTRIQVAERGMESSQFALAEARLLVLSTVRETFYQVLQRKGEIDLANENLRSVERLRQRIEVLVNAGEAGRLELARAEAESALARTFATSARLRLIAALSQFRSALGAHAGEDLDAAGTLERPSSLPPLEQLRAELLERHPTLALLRSEVRRAEARVGYERALRIPQPSIASEIDIFPDNPTYSVGVSIPIPFWNKRKGPIAEASALMRQAEALVRARQIELLADLEGAYDRFQVAGQQIVAFEQGVLREAEEALQGAETAYQLGERGIIEVLDAQRVLRDARLNYLNAQYEQQAALIDVDQLRAVELRRSVP